MQDPTARPTRVGRSIALGGSRSRFFFAEIVDRWKGNRSHALDRGQGGGSAILNFQTISRLGHGRSDGSTGHYPQKLKELRQTIAEGRL